MDKGREDRKTLMHSEIHFRGYWVQLQSRIRKNDDADDFLEGYLTNPLVELRKAWDEHHSNPRPAGDNVVQLYNTGESVSSFYNYATCIKTLYDGSEFGDPPGTFPPTMAQLNNDPMKHFKFFIQATEKGTNGGKNAQDRADAATKAWVKTAVEDVMRCRKACKHIWDTALATFTSAKATTVISGLPYGSGPALLDQIENQQERQTTMALFTLFDQLITIKLGAKENFASLYARALGIRARLKNWRPPIVLPDQLIIVCLMRMLPRQFHGTRTIIMSTAGITLSSCRDMLLDAENRDAERVKRELGTATTLKEEPQREGTGLLGDGGDGQRTNKRRKKKRKQAEKSEKYKTEGPCSVHGSRCSHASSECYVLHPELKPNKKAEAAVAEAAVAEADQDLQPYGFMNEDLGYCLMMFEDDDEKQDDDVAEEESRSAIPDDSPSDAAATYATPVRKGASKIYAVAIGHQTGIFYDYATACKAYMGYPGHKFKSFKDMDKAKQYLLENEIPTATYVKKITRRKPKNYKWSQSGTKASRRKKKNAGAKNTIHGEVIKCKRGNSSVYKDENVKRMARTGGVKDISRTGINAVAPEVIDLSEDPMMQDAVRDEEQSGTPLDSDERARQFKNSAADPSDDIKDLQDRAVESLVEIIRTQDSSEKLRVRSTRSFAPGLTTTMLHPARIPRHAVSDADTAAREGVTLEVTLDMATLQKVVPGARIKLKVERIETSSGEALITDSNVEDGPYDFMDEYDADIESDSDIEWYEVDNAEPWKETSHKDLSEDDDESSEEPPPLVKVPPGYTSSEPSTSSDSESESEPKDQPEKVDVAPECSAATEAVDSGSESEGPPGLIDLPPGYSTSSDGFTSSDSSSEASLVDVSNSSSDTYESDSSDEGPPLVDVSDSCSDTPESDSCDNAEKCEVQRQKESICGKALVNGGRASGNNTALDSGATEHCAKHVPGTLEAATVDAMSGLNGKRTEVSGMARVKKVKNVMCMPGISRNLLSVGRLLDEHGGQVAFTKDQAHLVTQRKHVLVAKRAKSGLYIVCNKDFELAHKTGEALAGSSVGLEVAKQRVIALHKAYGHASVSALRVIIKNRNFDGVKVEHLKLLPPCEACMLGKAHKTPKKRTASEKATRFAERLCADCCVPFRKRSVGGSLYALIVVCEFSAWTWVFPIPNLPRVPTHLTTVLEVDLHQRDDRNVKYFRSDGGTEFNNKKVDALLAKHGIVRETTCAGTSFQNGKAERRIRTLFDRVRTTLSDAGRYLTRGFWADALVYAAYTLNRTPTEDAKSPFELRYGRPPKISHLRPFGNPCVAYRKRTVAGKIEDAGVKSTFLGYGYVHGKKGYRVRIDGTNSVITTRDVSFCAFESKPVEVQLLETDPTPTPDAVVTEPANAEDIAARLNTPVGENNGVNDEDAANEATEREVSAVITEPANAVEAAKVLKGTHTYLTGAKVEANWKSRGTYFPAVITGVHKAGTNGSRTTYDLVYECDGESERHVSRTDIRPRTGKANVATKKPCGHALVTDCHPAYLADVPDLARTHVTPKHYGQAKDNPRWTKSMQDELESLRKQGVYAFVDELPTGEIALRCLWVYKVKCGPNGEVTRYKSRLTVNGKSQRYGIDYQKTFSPVAFATSIRLLFALGLANKFKFRQYDIKCAFLYADLPKEQQVYMHAPPGSGRKGYWLLRKSLYGLCQAPMLFNGHLDGTLKELGFQSCTFDPCLYVHRKTGSCLVVVVDDMVLACPTDEFANQFYKDLSKKYDVKDLGKPNYVIGVRVAIDDKSVRFTQDRYISDLHALHNPGQAPTNTPASAQVTLCATGIYKQDDSPLLSDPKMYRSLVGGLMYTLITRPDVATAVSVCARYVQTPREAHLEAAKRILRYLYHTRERPLVYYVCNNILVKAFVDSSWGNDVDTRRSRFGYGIYVGKCLIAWCSKLHPALAMSSAEAEYTAATEAVKCVKWIVSLMSFLGAKPQTPVAVYEDNAACRVMAESTQVSGRNKHFELRQHFVREQVTLGLVQLLPINTKEQIADIFTKPTVRPIFEKHATALLQGLPDKFLDTATVEGGS